jgi:hypothetical protein
MSHISITQYAQAFAKQKSLNDAEWLRRCDELAAQQPVMFYELMTFLRDGVPVELGRSLIDFLSTLQAASSLVSKSVSLPVQLHEFQAAIKRTVQFFHALSTDDHAHLERMIKARFEGMDGGNGGVVWAGCIEILREPEIMAHPLFKAMVVTLCAVAEVYSRRFSTD